jgi:hypothetical protein
MIGLRRIGPLIAVGALLGAAAIAASLATPQLTRVPIPSGVRNSANPNAQASGPAAAAPPNTGAAVQHSMQVPGWVVGLISGLCLAIVVAIIGFLVWYLLRDSLTTRKARLPVDDGTVTPLLPQHDEVLAAVDAGLSDLADTDADARRAVIACWVRLEQTAAAAGTPRAPGDSPTDLVLRLLAAHQVSSSVLYPLAEVYRLARYATHTVDERMRDQAQAALRQLRAELANEPVLGGPRR